MQHPILPLPPASATVRAPKSAGRELHGLSRTLRVAARGFHWVGLLTLTLTLGAAPVRIEVQAGRTLNPLSGGHPLGANLCWYFDREEPAAAAVQKAGLKVLRFPFGHRGDNYLWDTPPWPSRPGEGLVPRIASLAEKPAAEPGVIHPDGTFVKHMDTDEFMRLVRRTGATPIMMVNVLSYKYDGGPSYEALKASAVEWVRYCNVTCGYGIKYWEIGNEVDLRKSPMTLEEYGPLFRDFARAMKAVDPTIQVGLGLNVNLDWMRHLLDEVQAEADFMVAHQYNSIAEPLIDRYEVYRTSTKRIARNIEAAREVALRSKHPHGATLPLLITEFSSFSPAGIYREGDRQQDLYKGLITFDLTAELLRVPTVRYATFWSLHDPHGANNMVGLASARDGRLQPHGEALALIARHLGTEIVDSTFQEGTVRSLASLDRSQRRLAVWLVNRDEGEQTVEVQVTGGKLGRGTARYELSGTGPHDERPTTTPRQAPVAQENRFTTALPGCSASVFVFDFAPTR